MHRAIATRLHSWSSTASNIFSPHNGRIKRIFFDLQFRNVTNFLFSLARKVFKLPYHILRHVEFRLPYFLIYPYFPYLIYPYFLISLPHSQTCWVSSTILLNHVRHFIAVPVGLISPRGMAIFWPGGAGEVNTGDVRAAAQGHRAVQLATIDSIWWMAVKETPT